MPTRSQYFHPTPTRAILARRLAVLRGAPGRRPGFRAWLTRLFHPFRR